MKRFKNIFLVLVLVSSQCFAATPAEETLEKIDVDKGIVALIDLPDGSPKSLLDLAKASGLTIYFQSDDQAQVAAVRKSAEEAGLLGDRIFVDSGSLESIHLGNNVADSILVAESARQKVNEKELLRALRPKAAAFIGDRKIVKPVPEGMDDWSHPYHGPDNNPQSNDKLVRGKFQTQFIAVPKFSPMPEQSVAAGGRLFKAMGHIAHKENQNAWLNTLLCTNAYNGTILWKRPLPEGFLLHRNTMIATDDALLMGDHESCKIFDGRTGKVRDQITIPKEITDGQTWKWMAVKDGILYALVGNPEVKVETLKSLKRGLGHWPWGMWKGHDYKDPRTAFGYGRTIVAIDLKTKKLLWNFREKEFFDARAVCMKNDRIYCYCPEKFLACINAKTGKLIFKNNDKELLDEIGPNEKAQHYKTGYSTTCYMKCSDDQIFFAGPQRKKMVVASAKNGIFGWTHPVGNLQLVLRDDAIYAAGPQNTSGAKLDYETGSLLAKFPARRACTRATGCADSIFYRASGGTVRVMTETDTATHIAPMRPPCQDGVLVSNGHLYWGPWMCGCQLSLYGHIALKPTTEELSDPATIYQNALVTSKNISNVVKPLEINAGDWPSYRGNNARGDVTQVKIPAGVKLLWKADITSTDLPTAPVAAGGMVFIADRTGAVRAFDNNGNEVWKAYTSAPIYYPPAVAHDRVYVGSADGHVYAYAARSGRLLWSFRVAPQDRRIPVYGKLISRWPIAGGVVVENGSVYAAAGIAHYDGTYLVALDAVTGQLQASNTTSGTISEEVQNGISMQGNLTAVDGELRFLAGGVYETARYDLKTLKCLNEPKVQVTSQYRTAFYPYYPSYGKYLSLEQTLEDGSTLAHDASYEGNLFVNLALEAPLPPGVPRTKKEAARWARRGKNVPKPKQVWQDKTDRRFTSFIRSGNQLLVTGHPDDTPEKIFLASINIKDGSDAWLEELPAEVVKGGSAIDHQGRIYVSLENGALLCFGPEEE